MNEPKDVIAARTCRCDGMREGEYFKECIFHRVHYARQIEQFFASYDPKYYKNYV